MTTTVCSKRSGFWNNAYFLGELKRSWANALLYAIAFFFTLTVPIMLEVSSYLDRDKMYGIQLDNFVFAPLLTVVAMGIALWAACSATNYLMRRTSSYYYHSLPLRREGMVLIKSAVAGLDFLAALLVNLLLSGVMLLRVASFIENPGHLWLCVAYLILTFVLVFSLVQLLAMLCGTRTFHLILCAISFILGIALVGMIGLLSENFNTLLVVDLLSDEAMQYTSPYYFLIYHTTSEQIVMSAAEWIGCAIFALLCFGGTLLLARIRPAEGAESSVVFRPVGQVVKYVVMVPATFYMGYLFEELGGGLWMFFGVVSGALLCFMLMNVLISRGVRNMFRGVAWLALYGVLFIVGIFGTTMYLSYLEYHAYPTGQIASVTINVHGDRGGFYTLTDPRAIEATSDFVDDFLALAKQNNNVNRPTANAVPVDLDAEFYEKYYDVYDEYTIDRLKAMEAANGLMRSMEITETTHLGTSRTWRVNIDRFPELLAQVEAMNRAIADSDEFAEQYISFFCWLADYVHDVKHTFLDLDPDIYERVVTNPALNDMQQGVASPAFQAAVEELRAQIGYDFFQQPQVHSIWISAHKNGRYFSFNVPIYASQTKLLEYYGLADGQTLIEVYAEAFGKKAKSGYMLGGYTVDPENNLIVVDVYDKEDISEIWRGAAVISYPKYGNQTPFFLTAVDASCFFRGNENLTNV
ncbi:MAG: hypothetical protein IKL84_07585, partial [Clostridia bacterium]|nr:hypothetical protein [Clostridia bacterium]